MSSVRQFWNDRATLGATAGTQDLIAKQLEHRAILAEVERLQPKRILEVGCGRGELAQEITYDCPWVEHYDAVDNSDGMIEAANDVWHYPDNLEFHCLEMDNLPPGPYDCIITERMLINLPSGEAQEQAIALFASRLVSGGAYLMCENFQEGREAINVLRTAIGLTPIPEGHQHNRYLSGDIGWVDCGLTVEKEDRFSATYYFLSRIVNAEMAKQAGKDPDYDSRINRLALRLPGDLVDSELAMARLWVWRKA